MPVEYLGYILDLGDGPPGKKWLHHNMKLHSKFKQCCEKLKHSSFRREDLPRIVNSDINSIIVYGSYANYMPLKGKINFGETGRITSVNLSMFYHLLWKAIRKKLKLVDGCPRAMLYNNSYKLGFGI